MEYYMCVHTSELFGCQFIENLLHTGVTKSVVYSDAGSSPYGVGGEPIAVDE